jgi:hypothetical protein
MGVKTLLFDELPVVDEIEIDAEYTAYYHPGCTQLAPEDCYPPEVEIEIRLPDGWEQNVIEKYLAAAREAIKGIEAEIRKMEEDEEPLEW